MRMPTVLQATIGCALIMAANAYAHNHDHNHEARHAAAHVHGLGQLALAMDGSRLEIELSIPAHDILGFETLATDEQRKQLNSALAKLEESSVWAPNAEAECRFVTAAANASTHNNDDHDRHGHSDHGHDDHDDHDDHNHDSEKASSHMDIHASYTFECRQPAKFNSLSTTLFKTFERSEKIKLQGFTAAGQFSGELTRNQPEARF